MNLTRVAITRPVFIFMLMLAAFLLGTISYRSMRLELNPEVNFGVVTVATSYPGAGPDDINELISRKVEEAVSGVNNVREVTSVSQEGLSIVTVQLELGSNADAALNDVRSKVDSITNDLPKDALKPQVTKFDTSGQPVLYLAIASKSLSSKQLRDLIDDKIVDRFAQISGVASANVQGGDEREIQVHVDKDRLLQYGLGIVDITRAVNAASANTPGGRLVSGPQEYTVRLKAQFEKPEQISDMIITISDPNNPQAKSKTLRLRDVATVKDAVVDRTSYARLNEKDTIVIAIQKITEGNAVEITAAAKAVIAQVEKEFPGANLQITIIQEQAKQITESLADLNFALFFGIFLVAVIVFIFLHNMRGTLIVALAIPTSIFATFIALKLLGFTINNLSMLALSLAIGVLVDDAIVVLENIYRHLKMGEHPREAAINGRAEIGLAAIAITMADVVVFLPIAFMGGIVGQFFKPLAVGFVFAVLFSLFVSFTLTPLLASRWYRAGEDMEHPTGAFAKWFERMFARLEGFYRRSLEWALKHRWFVFIAGNIALVAVFLFLAGSFVPSSLPPGEAAAAGPPSVGIGAAFMRGVPLLFIALAIGVIVFVGNLFRGHVKPRFLLSALAFGMVFPIAAMAGYGYAQWKGGQVFKFGFLPDSDSGTVSANIELPPGSSLAQTQQIVEIVEKKFSADPDVKYVLSNVGTQGSGGFSTANSGSNYAQVQGTLYDKRAITDRLPWIKHEEKLRDRSSESVAATLVQSVGRVAGAKVDVAAASSFGFGKAIQLSFTSDDRDALFKTADAVRDGLDRGDIKGVINPDLSSKPGKPELQVLPDRLSLADNGLDVATAGNALRTMYQGNDDTKLRVSGREHPVRVQLSDKDRNNPRVLSEVPITFRQGEPVYLDSVATIKQAPGIDKITRRQRAEEVTVTADLLPGFANGSVQAQIDAWLIKNKLVEEGVKYRPLGQADSQARESGFLFGALGIGLVLVYMLLAALYDNLLYPLIIQLSQPQALVGAILALVLTDKSLNLVGFIGIICLVGLVGKNAILLVDYTNTLRDRGRNRHDALVEAGPTRLRPILMTTLALILGTLPVALAIGRGSEFRETIGITIIGGISLSTFLTLLVIPCSYTIFDDISNTIGRLRGQAPEHGDPNGDSISGPTGSAVRVEA